jgi:hypothetical protein
MHFIPEHSENIIDNKSSHCALMDITITPIQNEWALPS